MTPKIGGAPAPPRPWSRVCLRVAGLLAAAGPAHAQLPAAASTTIDAQLWQPAIGPRNFITVENTAIPEHKLFGFGLSLNYQRHPYIVYTQGYDDGASNLVDSQWTTELSASMGLFGALPGRARAAVHALSGGRRDRRDGAAEPLPPHRERHRRPAHRGQGADRDAGRGRGVHGRRVGGLSLPTGKNVDRRLPGRQDRHRPDQGDRRRRLRQGARRRQPRHPAARDLGELQDRDGAPAALRRRGGLPVDAAST